MKTKITALAIVLAVAIAATVVAAHPFGSAETIPSPEQSDPTAGINPSVEQSLLGMMAEGVADFDDGAVLTTLKPVPIVNLSRVGCWAPPNETRLRRGTVADCVAEGDWLDITDRVSVTGKGVVVSISSKGKGIYGHDLPYVIIHVQVSPTARLGDRTITMSRPAFMGRDSDRFLVTIVVQAQ